MSRIQYEEWSPRADARLTIHRANDIAAQYAAQGYDLTLRQLYYQFVSRDFLPNTQESYDKLGQVVNRARMAGLMDWDYIIDRTRNLQSLPHWEDPAEIISATSRQFRLDKWVGQPTRVEVWVEKEALAGVIQRAAARWDCAWFSCRGYVSQSEMWGAAQRLGGYIENGQNVVILHLGDHDPSGIDMTRDIRERLERFIAVDYLDRTAGGGFWDFKENYEEEASLVMDDITDRLDGRDPLVIERIALNYSQVQQYNPPPNPAKMTDSRATDYVRQYGRQSWELDALEPAVLDALIEANIIRFMNPDMYQANAADEDHHRQTLQKMSNNYSSVVEYLETAS